LQSRCIGVQVSGASAGMTKRQVLMADQKRMAEPQVPMMIQTRVTKSQSSTICLDICVHPWFFSCIGVICVICG
jgi:hypothetical protein